jgi:hypothetical protein
MWVYTIQLDGEHSLPALSADLSFLASANNSIYSCYDSNQLLIINQG